MASEEPGIAGDFGASSLLRSFAETRALTLELVALANEDEWSASLHPDFSPVGWHVGHIAAFEAYWVLERACGEAPISAELSRIFDPRANPKEERGRLPSRRELLAWASEVRAKALAAVERAPADPTLGRGLFAWWFVLSHEQQHAETIATVLRLRSRARREASGWPLPISASPSGIHRRLRVLGGEGIVGDDDVRVGYDNERPAHRVQLRSFEIDPHPVSNAEWLEFVDDRGYERREFWTEAGWSFARGAKLGHPFTWQKTGSGWQLKAFAGDVPLPLWHPVEGVSAHEADAYAKFRGRRLPTEAEWEYAASYQATREPRLGVRCGGTRGVGTSQDFLGNVWEWTSSTFAGYPGFQAFPYEGYSQAYFDGRHRVLRGGSWATQWRNARPAFRNWYEPHWRAIFAGLRLARDL